MLSDVIWSVVDEPVSSAIVSPSTALGSVKSTDTEIVATGPMLPAPSTARTSKSWSPSSSVTGTGSSVTVDHDAPLTRHSYAAVPLGSSGSSHENSRSESRVNLSVAETPVSCSNRRPVIADPVRSTTKVPMKSSPETPSPSPSNGMPTGSRKPGVPLAAVNRYVPSSRDSVDGSSTNSKSTRELPST